MATVKFKRKTEEEITNMPIEDGSIGGGVSKEYVDEKITGALEASY